MNQKIKSYAREKGEKLWQVADELKITDGQLSRKLRYEEACKTGGMTHGITIITIQGRHLRETIKRGWRCH